MERIGLGRLGAWGVSFTLALSVALTATTPAFAFCRSMSCELGKPENNDCKRDGHLCVTEGAPLHWANPCLQYAVQGDDSPKAGLSRAEFLEKIEQAFAAWEGVTCPGGGSPRFHAQFQGYVRCHQHEAVCGKIDKNVNAMMFHDSAWPGELGEIGLTTPTGGTQSGEVFDADLQLNSEHFDFTAGSTAANAKDLSQVLAHEVGHFLGLAHSDADGALMSPGYNQLLTSRELLTEDDIAAICTVYPPGAALDCPSPPAPPVYDACQIVPGTEQDCVISSMTHHDRDSSGCGCNLASSPREHVEGALSALLGALGLIGLRRRRSR